jgi:hypothetical protein
VVAWGDNSAGQTNVPAGLTNVLAVAAGRDHSLALTIDHRVIGWGNNTYGPTNVPGWLTNAIAVAAGSGFSLALTSDGHVVQWGSPPSLPNGLTNVVAIAAGWTHCLAVNSDGTVVAWGDNGSGQTNVPGGLSNAVAVAAGERHSLALTADGRVVGWGDDSSGQASFANGLTNLVAIAAGSIHSLALTAEGRLVLSPATGYGLTNVPGWLTYVAGVGAGWIHSVALAASGQVVAWGNNSYGQTNVPSGLTNAMAVAAGLTYSLAISSDAPFGTPIVTVDGKLIVTEAAVSRRGSARVTLWTRFPSGTLLYTLDGSDPATAGTLYSGPFDVSRTSLLRTIAYNMSFTTAAPGQPLTINILRTIIASTAGGGTIAVQPPDGDYFSNSVAVLTAIPASGWSFLQWLGDANGTNPTINVSMTRNKTARAVFGTAVGTSVVGAGSIVASPAALLYPFGTQIRFTAVPAAANYFAFWGNAASGSNNPLTFRVTSAQPTVTAVLPSIGGTQSNALAVIPDGHGAVTLNPSGNLFPHNTNVLLQATPEAGQDFLGWSGAASGSQNPLVVAMSSNKVVTATFTKRPLLQIEAYPDLLNQAGSRVTVIGDVGATYQILGSTDFTTWTSLGSISNAWGTVQLSDAGATNTPWRVYRAQSQ